MPNLQLGTNRRLRQLNQTPIPPRLTILIIESPNHILLSLTRQRKRQKSIRLRRFLQLTRVFFDNRKLLVYFAETGVAEFVGAVQVRGEVGVRGLQVGVQGGDEFLVEGLGEGEGFCAVGVLFVEGEGVLDYGVGLEVLGNWLVEVGKMRLLGQVVIGGRMGRMGRMEGYVYVDGMGWGGE